MERITCCACGVEFDVPENYLSQLRKCHNTFYCPNGHKLVFDNETEEEKLIRGLRRNVKYYKNRMLIYKKEVTNLIRSRAYYKGRLLKLKKEKP